MSLHTYISSDAFAAVLHAREVKDSYVSSRVFFPSSSELIQHMLVARLKKGEQCVIADGKGQGLVLELCEDIHRGKQETALSVLLIRTLKAAPKPQVTLVQGLAAADRMDLVIRQATELGASRIIPLKSERSQVHLVGNAAARKLDRWQRIARAAAEQSQQLVLPEISAPLKLEEALAETSTTTTRICCWEESEHGSVGEALGVLSITPELAPNKPEQPSVALFIGPEGGFSSREVAALREAGARIVSLGSTILRTETAAVVATALVLSALGALGAPQSGE